MASKKITRFPPEPNGYLHLGHLKAMMFDFSEDSECILRMDDTNPEVEKQEFVDAICEDVKNLGFEYSRLTFTSDYFDDLYKFAIKLIEKGKAYVDFSNPETMKEERHNGIESEYRSKSIDWNLLEFNNMLNRKYKENEAVLRLKIDMHNNNHSLRDPVAYRIKYHPHYRTGTKYCIYPSYDYSHGIVDALESVTDSYCTMEFYVRRELYYWPVYELELKPAVVSEFGRLNLENVKLSKRQIIPLIENKILSGYDDPRLYTIRGLFRRGFTAEILKSIISKATTTDITRHESFISKSLIDYELRTSLDAKVTRAFAVLDPLIVYLNDCDLDKICVHPNHPVNKDYGYHETKLTNTIYIDRCDFREIDSLDYYRLAPNKIVRLKYSDFVKCESYDLTNNRINVRLDNPEKPKKIKGIIHWVNNNSHSAIFEIYPDNLTDPVKIYNGFVEEYVMESINKNYKIFQFERIGYFKFDRYENNIPVFIQVIGLLDKYSVE